jgi:uncharacterized sodium:solute symporter family permease YidK
MVQRALAAESLSHAQGGTLFAGFAKILPVFLMVMPGMISRVLYTDEVACATPETCLAACGSDVSCTNMAYPKLVLDIMPVGQFESSIDIYLRNYDSLGSEVIKKIKHRCLSVITKKMRFH